MYELSMQETDQVDGGVACEIAIGAAVVGAVVVAAVVVGVTIAAYQNNWHGFRDNVDAAAANVSATAYATTNAVGNAIGSGVAAAGNSIGAWINANRWW